MTTTSRLHRLLPFLRWFPLRGATLRADAVAGLTVALLLIPQSMAYAELAGMPAYYGLYAAFVPVILGALFGWLHQLGTGPVAMTSILTASILTPYAAQGSDKYVQMAILLALMVGFVRVLMGVLRLAFLVNFISHPVIAGFTNAGALIIGLSQINKIFGVEKGNSVHFLGFMQDLWGVCLNLSHTHSLTLAFGLGSMIVIWACKKWIPAIPGMLVAVVISIIISGTMGFETLGGSVVGKIPEGLPGFGILAWDFEGNESMPIWQSAAELLPGAIMVMLISFMEVLAVSKAISLKTKQPLNLNQELIGQGISAIGGSFAQSYPTSGSFSRSAMNLMSGAKTGFSSVVTAAVVVLILCFMTPYLYHLPKATLAAGIMMSVVGLINIDPIQRAYRANRADGHAAVFTFVATLAFAPSIVNGVLYGTALALGIYIYRTMKPNVVTLETPEAIQAWTGHSDACDDASCNSVVLRFEGSLYFASVTYFENRLLEAISHRPEASHIIVMAQGINRIDASGEWALLQLLDQLRENNFSLWFVGMREQPKAVLKHTGLVDLIGEAHFRPTLISVMEAIHAEKPSAPDRDATNN